MKFSVVVPTYQAAVHLDALLPALRGQTAQPEHYIVVDSSSSDGTRDAFRAFGATVRRIEKSAFNHGGTRQFASTLSEADVPILIYLTQDAIPERPDAFERILSSFADETVGIAYGRQMPRPGAGPLERFPRYFNYPERDQTKEHADAARLGLKTFFCSDSFAAYRRKALLEVGGFPISAYCSEEQVVAARMLLRGWKVAYRADAMVTHSHDLSVWSEARRYFDIAAAYRKNAWMMAEFGAPEGEGARYVAAELAYLWREAPCLIPSALVRSAAKFIFYNLGWRHEVLPVEVRRLLSSQPQQWRAEASAPPSA